MKAANKGSTKSKFTMSEARAEPIRCAMTDEQYHSVYNDVSECDALVSLLRTHVGDEADAEVLVGLRLVKERLLIIEQKLERSWDETREASGAGRHCLEEVRHG